MYWLIGIMTLGIAGLVVTGVYLELHPAHQNTAHRWSHAAIGTNLVLFVAALATKLNCASCLSTSACAASSLCQSSAFLTGFFAAVFQPFFFQPWIQPVTPFFT